MKKLYTAILAISTLSMGSQLIAGPENLQPVPAPAPAPAPVVPAPAPAPVLPALGENGELNLQDLELGDARIIAIAPHFPAGMTRLLLAGNDIGPEGAIAVADNLYRAPGLKVINLSFNHIGLDGVKAIAQHLPPGLERLSLTGCNIGNAEMAGLVEHPFPITMNWIQLENNLIGNDGIIALGHRLQQNPIANGSILWLEGDHFGQEGRRALNDAGYQEGDVEGQWLRNVPAAEAGHDH